MTKVTTRITEIYDLHTQVDKIGLIGIKTPEMISINNNYRGLLQNFKKVRMVSCDVAMACASVLPTDPMQIGFEAGQQIDPRDMFNPILYTAVSNESMGSLMSRIYADTLSSPTLTGDSVTYLDNAGEWIDENGEPVTYDQHSIYYALLGSGHFRKAMPQQGMQMSNLRPRVFPVATSRHISATSMNTGNATVGRFTEMPLGSDSEDAGVRGISGRVYSVSLQSVPMPALDTVAYVRVGEAIPQTIGANGPQDSLLTPVTTIPNSSDVNRAPAVYVGAIITPPARSQQFYYRMTVTWTIEFYGLRPSSEINSLENLEKYADMLYHTDYDTQSQNMSMRTTMVDTGDMPIEPVTTKIQ